MYLKSRKFLKILIVQTDRVVRIRAFPPRVTVPAIKTSNYSPDDIPRLSVSVDYPREFASNHCTSRNYSDAYPHPD